MHWKKLPTIFRSRNDTRQSEGSGRPLAALAIMSWPAGKWLVTGLFLFSGLLLLVVGFQQWRYRRQQRAVQNRLRERIARDFHDELGNKLTVINLYSELLSREVSSQPGPARQYLEKIRSAARDLYQGMKDLIWSLQPAEDTLEDLWQRLLASGRDILQEGGGVTFRHRLHSPRTNITLAPEQQRHILLIFKEAMNNSLRHARCTEASLELTQQNSRLQFVFEDNGRGFEPGETGAGEGLKNMRHRSERIGGRLVIESSAAGTRITLYCPI